jgi:hypothetical protein
MSLNDAAITPTLSSQINAEHHAVESAAQTAFAHALRAGELLLQAKRVVGHGGWGRWLAENFEGSERTAQLYMRVHERQAELPGDPQRVADLSLREAARLLAKPKSEMERLREVEAEIDRRIDELFTYGYAYRVLSERYKASGRDFDELWREYCNLPVELAYMMMNHDRSGILEFALSSS